MTAISRRWRFGLRRLTAGETALAGEVFGPALDAARVRILFHCVGFLGRAFVAGPGLIVWPAREASPDFACAPLADRAVFVHELVHVWQAQAGINLILGKLRAGDGPAAYAYDLSGRVDFARLNIEQQAMVVQHAFELRHGGTAPFAAEAYAQALDGRLRI